MLTHTAQRGVVARRRLPACLPASLVCKRLEVGVPAAGAGVMVGGWRVAVGVNGNWQSVWMAIGKATHVLLYCKASGSGSLRGCGLPGGVRLVKTVG